MLGVLGSSEDGTAEAEGGGGGEGGVVGTSLSEEEKVRIEEGERSSSRGGNRWPRQETLALLKIRSDMDAAFRDSSLKGPLWEEVSRKLAELGFHRSAKKCKEKFENVYKYHKRTKEGRSTKSEGKNYRFFDQLEALENQPNSLQFLTPPRSQPQAMPLTIANPLPTQPPPPLIVSQVSIPPIPNPINPLLSNQPPPPNPTQNTGMASSHPKMPENSASISNSSASTSSDVDPERRRKRKRKWEAFFQRLMKEVVQKQEEMQKKFLETLERRERDRVAREEAWRAQEMARMNREHDLLAHERSIAATKDAAVIAFLQKVSDQQIPNAPQMQMQEPPIRHVQPPPPPPVQPQPQPQPQPAQLSIHPAANNLETLKNDNGGDNTNFLPTSSSRWPKTEVEALIKIRTELDSKYQEGVPKGPLWEEISSAMRKVGYNRNAKRCKEKWENINKYFKKVKESNKKRPEDSKTCPYFRQLDALYREKTSKIGGGDTSSALDPMVPIMVQPEQQWPLSQENDHSNNHDSGEDEEEEDEAVGYEIVTNKASSVGTGE
ncbi:Trihelix transcription factor GT-2 like [Actinidia chinensis var. chinensis]|uniref:Trihelix transcription factor GT-2 like n=1 Tax=Actinidia chinensis var. chinensis TaxID=1590841 RepID=A0A2R6Q106_ACTCC|nr:Trihelix transcription factor GT-2 like [Actinidia chinensis var. chinensis]